MSVAGRSVEVRCHGYGGYTRGCRCQVCRQGKADYQRARRHMAYQQANRHTDESGYHFVPGITHGQYGYQERGCRCPICVEAKRKEGREYYHRRKTVAS